MEDIPGIKKDYQMHDARIMIQQYFSTMQNVVIAARSIPQQDNNYLTLRQRGQILGAETQTRGYRPTGGIQDRVKDSNNYRSLSTGSGLNYNPEMKPQSYHRNSLDYLV